MISLTTLDTKVAKPLQLKKCPEDCVDLIDSRVGFRLKGKSFSTIRKRCNVKGERAAPQHWSNADKFRAANVVPNREVKTWKLKPRTLGPNF